MRLSSPALSRPSPHHLSQIARYQNRQPAEERQVPQTQAAGLCNHPPQPLKSDASQQGWRAALHARHKVEPRPDAYRLQLQLRRISLRPNFLLRHAELDQYNVRCRVPDDAGGEFPVLTIPLETKRRRVNASDMKSLN